MRGRRANQAFAQAAAAAQAGFRAGHAAVVLRVVVVVAQKVKETMKGENAQLGGIGMAALERLPAGDAGGDHEIAEESRFGVAVRGRGSAPEPSG